MFFKSKHLDGLESELLKNLIEGYEKAFNEIKHPSYYLNHLLDKVYNVKMNDELEALNDSLNGLTPDELWIVANGLFSNLIDMQQHFFDVALMQYSKINDWSKGVALAWMLGDLIQNIKYLLFNEGNDQRKILVENRRYHFKRIKTFVKDYYTLADVLQEYIGKDSPISKEDIARLLNTVEKERGVSQVLTQPRS